MGIFKCNQRQCNGYGKPDIALHNEKFSSPVREGSVTLITWLKPAQPKPCLKCGECGHSWIPSELDCEIERLEQLAGVNPPLTDEQWECYVEHYKPASDNRTHRFGVSQIPEDEGIWCPITVKHRLETESGDVDIISPFD